ncbi:MAG: S-adenosylmethionine:tRNA ribosyltransferase-isomerase [Planctomycetota bacterium]|nr:S-adenosylmethionine:tRNA ribosyltransferase-isomerase [Planctomycetota bacterium]
MDTSTFDFDLPDDLIAQQPVEPRDQCRLMVVRRDSGTIEHRTFADLPDLLSPGDVLVRNNTRVVPARLLGHRETTGGKWEGLFLRDLGQGTWEILASTRGRPSIGERILVEGELSLVLVEKREAGRWLVRPESDEATPILLDRHGHVPLPPYIRKGRDDPSDRLTYQTVFAREPGAVAAPTAGLHFTEALFESLQFRGIASSDVTLHVGIGTFRPIEVERIEDHVLHAEWAELTEETARFLNAKRESGGRVVAVGTTSARTLETSALRGEFLAFAGETALYLKPGHAFRGVDALVTNFHLPRSSLLVLVSALAGVDLIREAYESAIRERYRFYSYGDAMLIL